MRSLQRTGVPKYSSFGERRDSERVRMFHVSFITKLPVAGIRHDVFVARLTTEFI